MRRSRFSAFELMLLRTHRQRDTASLLLLAWVFVNKRIALEEDRRYLEGLAGSYRHADDLDTLLAIATNGDSAAIQLAAEVLRAEGHDTPLQPLLRQAIGLATSAGELSPRNHHILRFLADLSAATSAVLAQIFQDVTGSALTSPGDPSCAAYWQTDDAEATAARRPAWQNWRRRRRRQVVRARRRWRAHRRDREQTKARARQAQAEARQEQARQHQAHQEQARREEHSHQRQEEQHRQQQRDKASAAARPNHRIRLALKVLELDETASPPEIKRAYRRLAQRHHPDRFHGQGELRMAIASRRFVRIKDAYEYLMRPV
ncbi:heat shock protein DnaJ-like protein [Salinisphaera sp. LB1]|nr:heat shock protein DnaJ-like protein [Salinisphaera sp. LB1]